MSSPAGHDGVSFGLIDIILNSKMTVDEDVAAAVRGFSGETSATVSGFSLIPTMTRRPTVSQLPVTLQGGSSVAADATVAELEGCSPLTAAICMGMLCTEQAL